MNNYVAVIQAGGKGTRMYDLTNDKIPKPLLKLNGKPMIEWQINSLKEYGISEFVIIVGHLGKMIEDYFGDGDKFGIKISYIYENEPLGSAGSLYYIKELVKDKDIIFIFGDVMFELDWNRFIKFHESKQGIITLLCHPNSHPYDSDLLVLDNESKVLNIDSKNNDRNHYYKNCVNSGLSIFKNCLLDVIKEKEKIDYEKVLVQQFISKGMVFAYNTPEYVKDVGTPDRFFIASDEQKKGIWDAKCLKNKQKAVFLDRDGTINKLKGFLSNIDDFELLPYVDEAIKKLNESEYLTIVITNQPVVARGECSFKELENIHKKLETLLGEKGAYLNDIFYCPHHPDKGFAGEVKELKIDCECRKPKIGMLKRASEKYNIDLSKSWLIGDSTVDIQTGKNANIKTILLKTGEAGNDDKYDIKAGVVKDSLLEAVNYILNDK